MSTEMATPQADYLRLFAQTPSPFPTPEAMLQAYSSLKEDLPQPENPFPDGKGIEASQVADYHLIFFPGSTAIVGPLIGDSTKPKDLFYYFACGQPAFELPPTGIDHDLNPDWPTAVVRNQRTRRDEALEARLIQTALATGLARNEDQATIYVRERMPVSTQWAAMAASDALARLDELTGGQLLDDTCRLRDTIAERTVVVNGDNGGGNMSVHRVRDRGETFPSTIVDFISSTQTLFVKNLVGANAATSIIGACGASGTALNWAEMRASYQEGPPADLFIVFSSYDGPMAVTQHLFDQAGLTPTQSLPYLGIKPRGFTESPAAVAGVVMTKRLADELDLPLEGAYRLITARDTGTKVWGVGRHDVPERTQKVIFERVKNECFPDKYDGTILVMTHGANTEGGPIDLAGLTAARREFLPNAQIVASTTQALSGHQFGPRTLLSLAMANVASREGIIFGLAPATYDLSVINEEQERLQKIRRQKLGKAIGQPISVEQIIFDPDSQAENKRLRTRTPRTIEKYRKKGLSLAYASCRIPKQLPLMAFHQGVGSESIGLALIPIG